MFLIYFNVSFYSPLVNYVVFKSDFGFMSWFSLFTCCINVYKCSTQQSIAVSVYHTMTIYEINLYIFFAPRHFCVISYPVSFMAVWSTSYQSTVIASEFYSYLKYSKAISMKMENQLLHSVKTINADWKKLFFWPCLLRLCLSASPLHSFYNLIWTKTDSV